MTTDDLAGYIALAVQNNKKGVIEGMNTTGNFISPSISSADLVEKLWNIFSQKGLAALKQVLDKVPVVTDKITEDQAKAVAIKIRGIDPNTRGKFWDWVKDAGNSFGGFIGGTSVSPGTVTNVSSTSVISPFMLGLIVVAGLILMVLFRKFVAVVVGIIVIVLAVVLYGIFAKNIQTTQTGGGTTTQGGVGAMIATFFSNLVKGG